MHLPVFISLLLLLPFGSALALPLVPIGSNDPSLSTRSDNCDAGNVCLVRRKKTNAAKARTTAKRKAWTDGKAARKVDKAKAGKEAQKDKAKVKSDRKARKTKKKAAKKTRADKAKANPNYAKKKEDHRLKNIEKQYKKNMNDPDVQVAFHPGVSNFLDTMKLHGKDRKKAKKYHKGVIKNEMTKGSQKGASKAVIKSTAHEGGDNPNESYHITANFLDGKGRAIQNTYKDHQTGNDKQGPGHHIYVDKGKGPAAYEKAYASVSPEQRASQQKAYSEKVAAKEKAAQEQREQRVTRKKAEQDAMKAHRNAKVTEAKTKADNMTAEEKQAAREARKAKQAAKKAS